MANELRQGVPSQVTADLSSDTIALSRDELKSLGVAAVFGPGATTGEIVDFLRGAVAA